MINACGSCFYMIISYMTHPCGDHFFMINACGGCFYMIISCGGRFYMTNSCGRVRHFMWKFPIETRIPCVMLQNCVFYNRITLDHVQDHGQNLGKTTILVGGSRLDHARITPFHWKFTIETRAHHLLIIILLKGGEP